MANQTVAAAGATILAGYLCGSIPVGILVGKAYGIDPRTQGSGNTGATNIARLLGPIPGGIVAVADVLKSFLPVLVAATLFGRDSWVPYLVGAAATVGHAYPLFAGFRGGKSVSAAFGAVLALFPFPSAVALALFFGLVIAGRIVSLASLTATAYFGLAIMFRESGNVPALTFVAVAVALIFYRHRQNIGRLIRGEEPRFQFGKLRAEVRK